MSSAVAVRNVSFGYSDSNLILDNINLNVAKNSIYGLLGPSGCGKTTLLKCILGMLKPKSGECSIFGELPGSEDCPVPGGGVGYMPQELALYMDFTIEESMLYFGRLFNMRPFDIRKKIAFLLQLLQLPKKTRLVKKLSCGQQRRVSLALALIHSPPLLILDEPTVGVDPVLRKTIWNYLVQLSNDGITVILTTHYSEEARAAATVAFMNNGRILSEGDPKMMMEKYETTTLEDIFFMLCQNNNCISLEDNEDQTKFRLLKDDELPLTSVENPIVKRKQTTQNGDNSISLMMNGHSDYPQEKEAFQKRFSSQFDLCQSSFVSRIDTLLTKNFHRLTRSWSTLIAFTLLPALQLFIIFICMGDGPHDLDIAVFNEEGTGKWGQIFLDNLDKSVVNLHSFNSFDDAIAEVEAGRMWGAVDISSHFTSAVKLRAASSLIDSLDNATLDESQIFLHMDMSNQMIAFQITKVFYLGILKFTEIIANKEMGINGDMVKPFVNIQPPVYGVDFMLLETKQYWFVLPGIYILLIFFTTAGMTCNLLIEERRDGLFNRSRVAGVKPVEFVLAHSIIQFAVLLIQIAVMLIVSMVIFPTPNFGSKTLIVLLLVSQGLAGMFFGLFVSSVCKQTQHADVFLLASFFPTAFMSGVLFPIQNMPGLLTQLSRFFPLTLAVDSMRSIMYRGWDIEYYQVFIGFIASYSWLVVFVVLTIFFLHRSL